MKKLDSILLWAPRVLAILFILFISLFALDAWDMNGSFWQKLGGFLIHLIPSFVMIAALALAWKWEWVGGIVFISAGLFYIIINRGPWTWDIIIAGPALLVGALFLADWYRRKVISGKRL